MENVYINSASKLTEEGFKIFKIIQKVSKWKQNYVFISEDDGFWWKCNSGCRSGRLFKTMEEAEFSALVNYCNNSTVERLIY